MIIEDTAKVQISNSPLDYKSADMLPVIKIMCSRYLSGDPPYDLIMEIWNGTKPIYLPAMWMPFIWAEWFSIDMRWIATFFAWCATSLTLYLAYLNKLSLPSFTTVVATLLLFWATILHIDIVVLTLTEEGVVYGYYGLLCFALLTKRDRLFGVSAALCLLSRYTLAPWLLFFLGYLILKGDKKRVKKMVAYILVTCILFMVISGAYTEIPTFLSLPDSYLEVVLAGRSKYEGLITSSLGMAKFIPYNSLGILHIVFKITAFLVPLLFFFCAYRQGNFGLSNELIALLCLKLCLVMFYNLLIIPYPYLFYVSSIVSIFVLTAVAKPSKLSTQLNTSRA